MMYHSVVELYNEVSMLYRELLQVGKHSSHYYDHILNISCVLTLSPASENAPLAEHFALLCHFEQRIFAAAW